MDDAHVLNATLKSMTESIQDGFANVGRRLDALEHALKVHHEHGLKLQETMIHIAAHAANIPGVADRRNVLLEDLEHLSRGDVALHWRAEVYEHDQELLASLERGEQFLAVVPPLDPQSFDDPDFNEFIDAQMAAAKKGVMIKRIYMFRTPAAHADALKTESVIRKHLHALVSHSREIELFTVALNSSYKDDFVIFGRNRCSVSREPVNKRNYARFPVIYSSRREVLEKCRQQWDTLLGRARKYTGA